MEDWRPVDWIPKVPIDKYSISSLGQIRNNYSNRILHQYTRKGSGTKFVLISTSPRSERVQLFHYWITPVRKYHDKKPINLTIDIAVLTAFVGRPEWAKRCIHVDGNKNNCALTNLRWDSKEEAKSSDVKKKEKKRNTLDEATVREICEILVHEYGSLKSSIRLIQEKFPDVKYHQIESIKYKIHYTEISDEYFSYSDRIFMPIKKR